MNQKLLSTVLRFYNWLTLRLYHEFAWAYDFVSWMVSLGQWDSIRDIALDYVVGEDILEVGFGTGELLLEFKRSGFHIVGVDGSIQMHIVSRRKQVKMGVTIPMVWAVTQNLPFKDHSFDTIVSTFPAGYILDPATWHEMNRLLRPNLMEEPGNLSDRLPGRIVVVGTYLWRTRQVRSAQDNSPVERGIDQFKQDFSTLATNAGLSFRLETHQIGGWTIPVIIAEKRPNILGPNILGDK